MSLILDALRKSERTRQQSLTGQLGAGETPAGPGRLPIPWIPVIAVILMLNAVLLVFLWPHAAPSPGTAAATPAAPPVYHPAVRPLAEEASSPEAGTEIAAPVPSPIAAPSPARDISALPTLDSLSQDLRASLPALHMDVHGYAANPRDRFVVIDLKQYHIGDVIADGLIVKDIVPQGAVLDFRGTAFLLPAE